MCTLACLSSFVAGHATLQRDALSPRALRLAQPTLAAFDEEKSEVRHNSVAAEYLDSNKVSGESPFACQVMIGCLIVSVCCGPTLSTCLGQYSIPFTWVLLLGVGVNLLYTKTLQRFLDGEPMNSWCSTVSISFCVVIFLMAMWTLIFLTVLVPLYIVAPKRLADFKNQHVAEIRAKFDELSESLSEKQQAYYKSQKFKAKCDKLFKKSDKDGNGVLDLTELRDTVLGLTQDPDKMLEDECFISAFDTNGNSEVEPDEFFEMMKYFDMINPGSQLADTDASSSDTDGEGGKAGGGVPDNESDFGASSSATASRQASKESAKGAGRP